jgi:hypothetical protein
MDNLKPNTRVSPYEAFEPAKDRDLATRLELHDTPERGSGPNIAEIELSRQCLDPHINDLHLRNAEHAA